MIKRNVFKECDLREIPHENFQIHYSVENGEFSCHIELNAIYSIEYIDCIFGSDIIEKALSVEYSCNQEEWISFDNFVIENSQVNLQMSDLISLRYLKIKSKDNLQIKNIHIYVRKFPGLMIAARTDGFGARFLPILNAMYLAEYTGFKFGFVWQSCHDNSLKEFEGNELAEMYVGEEKDIFSEEFIGEHSYAGVIKATSRSFDHRDIKKLVAKPYEKEWGNYINYNTARYIMYEIDRRYLKGYPKLWKQIGFSKTMQKVIDDASLSAKNKFPNGFVAIHIRSGDIVYGMAASHYRFSLAYEKAMPTEIAIELIKRNINNNIVLFGDDFNQLRKLKLYFNNKVNIIEDFIDYNVVGGGGSNE